MYVADFPASLTITNLGSLDVGIANIIIPANSSVTVSLSAMGMARKCDIWITAHAARLAGLVSTSPVTAAVVDAWYSAHHYRAPPALHSGTGGQEIPDGSGQLETGGQGENYPPIGVLPPPTGPGLDFSLPAQSGYVAVILYF